MATDSRTTQTEPALFWALTTPSGDGHRHLAEATERGCIAAVVTAEGWTKYGVQGLYALVVDDVWAALYLLAAAHRAAYRGPVVAIAGSNGKTSVKEQLAHLMCDPTVARSPRSYNSKLGVPLSVLQFPLDASLWVVEVGISEAGDMARFTSWLNPTHGIFTGLGDAHDSGFTSRESKLAEKMSLFGTVQKLLASEGPWTSSGTGLESVNSILHVPGDVLGVEGGFWVGPDGQRFLVPMESEAERSNAAS